MSAAIKQIMQSLEAWQASDLFLTEGKVPSARIHGTLRQADLPVTDRAQLLSFLDEALTPAARQRFERTGDLDAGYSLGPQRRFRFSVFRQQGLISMVIRALPSGELSFAELGLPPAVAELADLQRGLMLFTGATGAGKSTTLAAIVHHINSTRCAHVVTIEDPIEFVHREIKARISQREVNSDTASFHSALRAVVRQSPDVIVIGEMRDLETMRVAISAALTGHVVFATLHTIDVPQTLQRILSYFPEHQRSQAALDLSLCLRGIVSQRLLPRADGAGRVLAAEVLAVSPAAARLIQDQRIDEFADFMKSSGDPNVVTFNQALLALYQAGQISHETGCAHASNVEEFSLMARGMATGVSAFAQDGGLAGASGLDMQALLRMADDKGASDLHLTVGRPPIFRIDGGLYPLKVAPLSTVDMRMLLHSILSVRQRTCYELERELDFALSLEEGKRFRVNAYHQKGLMAASLRAIPSRIPQATELGLPDIVLQLGLRPHGLLLVVGPTGAGKTTTLACLVDRINSQRGCRIITVEDPIEYVHRSKAATVDQREVHADTISFAAALRFVLRQDPDVILVGELRDLETTAAALTAAETGHLVLGTMHTNDAVSVVDRIVDVFPAHQQAQVRSQMAASLLGVVSQRLLPRADGRGRVAAFEVLVATLAVRTLIRENKMHQALSVMETNRHEGMTTLDRSLVALYEAEVITQQDALHHIRDPRLIRGPARPASP